jgi:hypothetical protein
MCLILGRKHRLSTYQRRFRGKLNQPYIKLSVDLLADLAVENILLSARCFICIDRVGYRSVGYTQCLRESCMNARSLKSRSRSSEHNTDVDISFTVIYDDSLVYFESPGFKVNRRLNIVAIMYLLDSYPTRAGRCWSSSVL